MSLLSPTLAAVDPVAQRDKGAPGLLGLQPQENRQRAKDRDADRDQQQRRGEIIGRHGDTFDGAGR